MCKFIVFYGKMSWCFIWTWEWKCYFRPQAIMGFSSSTLLLLLFYFWQRDRGERLSPAQLGPPGSPPQPQGGRPGRCGVMRHLCTSVWPTGPLMEEPRHASSREDVCPSNRRPSLAHSKHLGASTATLRGHQQFPGHACVLVVFRLEDTKGDQIHWSVTLVEVMMAVLYRRPQFPNGLLMALKKDHCSLLPHGWAWGPRHEDSAAITVHIPALPQWAMLSSFLLSLLYIHLLLYFLTWKC